MRISPRRFIAVTVLLFVLLLGVFSVYAERFYLLLSLALALLSMAPFFFRFERRPPAARELVLLAVLAGIAAVSRVPFAALPSVQPTSFIVILSGIVLGAESGFMIGAAAALVSNLFLGQGLWTPWQMLAWGLMGLSAGLLRNGLRSRAKMAAFGFVWGFLFGWIMNLIEVVSRFGAIGWKEIGLFYAAGFYFDLLHAVGNVLFLWLFGPSLLSILTRFCRKHGFFSEDSSESKV
jgi:energy-coupling factor transport system substrate-specific component